MIQKKIVQYGPIDLVMSSKIIDSRDSASLFIKLSQNHKYKMLLESKDVSPIYGRMSLIGIDPIIHLKGKEENFKITSLNSRGKIFIEYLAKELSKKNSRIQVNNGIIQGVIHSETSVLDESSRSQKKNIAQVIRLFLTKFKSPEKTMMGLYGAFSYDFIRLFENINNNLPKNDIPDFNLFLYDTFIKIDHIKEKSEIICFRNSNEEGISTINSICNVLNTPMPQILPAVVKNQKFEFAKTDYESMVQRTREYITEGEIFEAVLANNLEADFEGDALDLYLKYREANPSPYMFYLDFGDEQLVGASPEMMTRCENGIVNLRPISGTNKRGKNSIEDHENMLELLNSKKERAELDMLVDLGRNDLTRVCEPNIKISDYRFVEKYSKVMHTVTHLEGRIRSECTAFDALVSTLNNGTLTGAPKVRAMQIIEQLETQRRGYYGGAVGYLTFGGDMDTCITIRTAHIKGNKLSLSAGATLVYDSDPTSEYEETMNKAAAFLSIICK